jgi:spermidine/putrescine transport system ATP-binding protein
MFVRPERMRLLDSQNTEENSLSATVKRRDLEGAYSTLTLSAQDQPLTVHLQHLGGAAKVSGEVTLGFDAADTLILPKGDIAHE